MVSWSYEFSTRFLEMLCCTNRRHSSTICLMVYFSCFLLSFKITTIVLPLKTSLFLSCGTTNSVIIKNPWDIFVWSRIGWLSIVSYSFFDISTWVWCVYKKTEPLYLPPTNTKITYLDRYNLFHTKFYFISHSWYSLVIRIFLVMMLFEFCQFYEPQDRLQFYLMRLKI